MKCLKCKKKIDCPYCGDQIKSFEVYFEKEIDIAVKMVEDAINIKSGEVSLVEAVSVLISQRDYLRSRYNELRKEFFCGR